MAGPAILRTFQVIYTYVKMPVYKQRCDIIWKVIKIDILIFDNIGYILNLTKYINAYVYTCMRELDKIW